MFESNFDCFHLWFSSVHWDCQICLHQTKRPEFDSNLYKYLQSFISRNFANTAEVCTQPLQLQELIFDRASRIILTYFLWAALSPARITKLSMTPSQRIVCPNWKVRKEEPANVANHFKTISDFFFFPPASLLSFLLASPAFTCTFTSKEAVLFEKRSRESRQLRWRGGLWWAGWDGEMVMGD